MDSPGLSAWVDHDAGWGCGLPAKRQNPDGRRLAVLVPDFCLIQGIGGIRKLRWSAHGKSGGARVIYYYHSTTTWTETAPPGDSPAAVITDERTTGAPSVIPHQVQFIPARLVVEDLRPLVAMPRLKWA